MMLSFSPNRVQKLIAEVYPKFWTSMRETSCQNQPLCSALKAENIKYRRRLFDPFVTLWVFLSQVLDPDKSCHNAVSRGKRMASK